MNIYSPQLEELRSRIPRRFTVDNVKEINSIVDEYEDILRKMEAIDSEYEKNTADFFAELDPIRTKIKMSTSNKASKKIKDQLFDEASGSLKDNLQLLINL